LEGVTETKVEEEIAEILSPIKIRKTDEEIRVEV
jgi:hypothetical protein